MVRKLKERHPPENKTLQTIALQTIGLRDFNISRFMNCFSVMNFCYKSIDIKARKEKNIKKAKYTGIVKSFPF